MKEFSKELCWAGLLAVSIFAAIVGSWHVGWSVAETILGQKDQSRIEQTVNRDAKSDKLREMTND